MGNPFEGKNNGSENPEKNLELGLNKVEALMGEVGGEEGIKSTVKNMNPEEIQRIKDRTVNELKRNIKTGVALTVAIGFVATLCEYYGIKDLSDSLQQMGGQMSETTATMGLGLMSATALAVPAGFFITIKNTFKLIKENIKNKAEQK